VQELRGIIESKKLVRILDVRPKTEFGICHLPLSIRTSCPLLPDSHPRFEFEHSSLIKSTDVPLYNLVANPGDYVSSEFETYVVCRLGNDSQIAADALRSARPDGPDPTFVIKDLVGGLRAWSRDVDPGFPVY
jgi:adenylyltransferase and sulfurtransferase